MGASSLPEKLLKPYDPKQTESEIYKAWEKSGFFNPDKCVEVGVVNKDADTFSMVLPPPNVTGTLHLGHAFESALQDAIVRYARMNGKKTLWVPGTDHAAIATQEKVEKVLYKTEGKTRHDFGRNEFLDRVNKFAEQSHNTIVNQIYKLGASLDWSREAFTLDDKRTLAVRTAFLKMYDAGLIYQGERIVNWDPKLQTTVSDDEIDWIDETTNLYYLKYGPFIIATARPETKFGDKYVVMHPEDKRYSQYKHRDNITLEWINGPIIATVIKDSVIDMEFGTGVMTVTPWHDATDFDIAERHNLKKEQIIDLSGKLLPNAGEFAGLHIKKARPLIVERMQQKGLVEKIDNGYLHRIATNSRGGGSIEPQILKQWFVDVNKEFAIKKSQIKGIDSGAITSLKQIMRLSVTNGQVKIIPERFEKVYFHWIDNLRDWCISRQLWYGHQIPVWYKGDRVYVGIEPPAVSWQDDGWIQDSDTLDTWFSSALWTFSTLGWPEFANSAKKGELGPENDLANFHPTTIIDPGYEILFFWVARMVLMSGFLLGEVPFKTAYIHGILRDSKGRKFSKSLDNGVDPLEMIDRYGADALRMSLIIGVGPGNDSAFSEQKVKAYKLFANKLWNITRFILTNIETAEYDENFSDWTKVDTTIRGERDNMLKDITDDMNNYRLYMATEKLYQYVWRTFADKVIEESKEIFKDNNKAGASRRHLLVETLKKMTAALHPFMPFITEEIWSMLPIKNRKMLIVERWPE
ncbi:MAG: valine--tRNA ligase [Candidatus Zambryskibacteria bacterium RIFCSPHIGHO2_01_FULL_43_25]|nr:MAG: valine--tRNA ligase [Candidatus Zambryskibacteria bacterium RIFCSPHIGHO2_01_FULL_43_25]